MNRTTWIALLQLEQGRPVSEVDQASAQDLYIKNLINASGDLTDDGWRAIHCLDKLKIAGIS